MNNPLSFSNPRANRIILLAFCIVSVCFFTASIQPNDFRLIAISQEFQSEIKKQSGSVHDLSADFIQSKYIHYLDARVESQGSLYFKKPGKIRWEYSRPYEFVLVINNGQFQLSDPQKKMIFKEKENEYFNEIGKLVHESLNGNILTNDKYQISLLANAEFYKLSMHPTNSSIKEIIENVEIIIDKERFQVNSFRFKEPSGDITIISLKNVITNLSLPDSKFEIH